VSFHEQPFGARKANQEPKIFTGQILNNIYVLYLRITNANTLFRSRANIGAVKFSLKLFLNILS